jgi:hypothetical protein
VKFGCWFCAAGIGAWPYDVDPPELLPPLLEVGDAHGSLGVAVGSGDDVDDGVGVSAALPRPAAADGLRLSTGTGSAVDDDEADGEADEPDADGDALASRPHKALSTGLAVGDELADGDALADCMPGTADGLSDGRSDGLGPLPSPANAVAATDANSATVAALSAADLRVIVLPPSVGDPPRIASVETDIPTETRLSRCVVGRRQDARARTPQR